MAFANLHISTKFPLAIVSMVLLTAFATGLTAERKFSHDLELSARSKLAALRESRQVTLEQYLESIKLDLRLLASSNVVRDALIEFTSAWYEIADAPDETLRRLYILDNPFDGPDRRKLNSASDGSSYSLRHAHYQPWFREFLEERGYYDIFLFTPTGDLVYTVIKENDFAANFLTGVWADTNLGKLFQTVNERPERGFQAFTDFERYEPSGGEPASFIATPLFDRGGTYIGVLAFQMPIDRINQVMRVRAGMGETGETYIVGQDFLMRTDSTFADISTVLAQRVDTEAARLALLGEQGVRDVLGHRGMEMVSAYGPLSFMGVDWAILADVSREELFAPVRDATQFMIVVSGAVLVVVVLMAIGLSRGLSRPIVTMTETMRKLAAGDLDVATEGTERGDEIGAMAQALAVFKENAEKRRLAERELQKSRDIIQALADNLPEFISMKDPDGRFLFVNKQFEEWTEKVRENVIGKTVFDIYDDEQAQAFHVLDQQVITSRRMLSDEIPLAYPDGSTRTVVRTRFPVISTSGDLLGLGTVNNDVTERKRMEDALRNSQHEISRKNQLLEVMLNTMDHGVCVYDENNCIATWNRSYRGMVGLPEGVVDVGSPVIEVFRQLAARGRYGSGDPEALAQARFAAVIGKSLREHEEIDHPSGQTIDIRRRKMPSGGYVLVSTDITELRDAERKLRILLDTSPVGISVISQQDGRRLFANQRLLEMIGAESVDEATSVDLKDTYVDAGDFETFRRMETATGTVSNFEAECRRLDGTNFWALQTSQSLGTFEGRDARVVWIVDISDRKEKENEIRVAKDQAESALADLQKTQEQLVQSEKMASLGQLTAGIAHEIKNPLNFVNNFAETSVELMEELKEEIDTVRDAFDDKARENVDDLLDTLTGDLAKINEHGRRADGIVKSMLLHSRGDASHRVETLVNPLVSEALNLTYHGERARDKAFQVTLDEQLQDSVGSAEIVPQDIMRVLVNLIGNAFYAVKKRAQQRPNGNYEPKVLVATIDSAKEVEIRVRDNGIGITPDIKEKLFDPFFTTKPPGEGTGLGLSICYEIVVRQHDGQMAVESEPGVFTEFIVRLPRHAVTSGETGLGTGNVIV